MKSPSIVYFVIVLLLCACHQNSAVNKALVQADALMLSRPDSSLNILRSIDTGTIRGKEQGARYALFLSQAYDKNYIDVRDDSLIAVAYNYYNRPDNKDVGRQALSCYFFGQIKLNVGDLEKATTSFLDAIKYGRQVDDYYLLGLSNTQLAMIYERQNLFPQAIEHYRMAFDEYSLADLPVEVEDAGTYLFQMSASGAIDGKFHIKVDGKNVTGSLDVPANGEWFKWEWFPRVPVRLELTEGTHTIQFYCEQVHYNAKDLKFTFLKGSVAGK